MMGLLEKVYENSPIVFQNIMVTLSGYERNLKRYGKTYWEYRKFLEDFDRWPLERKLEYQRLELVSLIRHAYDNSRFYRDLYAGIEINRIKTVEDLKLLPIVDKEMIRKNINDVVTIPRRGAVEDHTG